MSRDIVVFLGPTLPRDRGARLPPGALSATGRTGIRLSGCMLAYSRRAIVLIDGAFAKVPAVRHKEILWALSRGIEVYGAASMGALRAAELSAVGMRGYGLIYRWYRAVPFANDDEVAVAMTPSELGAQALSEALINMRLTLRRARAGRPYARRHEAQAGRPRPLDPVRRPHLSRAFSMRRDPLFPITGLAWSTRCSAGFRTMRSTRSRRTPSACCAAWATGGSLRPLRQGAAGAVPDDRGMGSRPRRCGPVFGGSSEELEHST